MIRLSVFYDVDPYLVHEQVPLLDGSAEFAAGAPLIGFRPNVGQGQRELIFEFNTQAAADIAKANLIKGGFRLEPRP